MIFPAPISPPPASYQCHLLRCAEVTCYPASDLYWAGQSDEPTSWGWHCVHCIGDPYNGLYHSRPGVCLRDFIYGRGAKG